jgi:hypothetical protein
MEKGGSWDDVGKAKGDMTMAFMFISFENSIQQSGRALLRKGSVKDGKIFALSWTFWPFVVW